MRLSIQPGIDSMTEEEEVALQERLKKAQKISKEIKTLERIFKPGSELDVTLYLGAKGGSAMSSLTLSKELRDEVQSAVLVTLQVRLISLRAEYDKL